MCLCSVLFSGDTVGEGADKMVSVEIAAIDSRNIVTPVQFSDTLVASVRFV